MAGVPLWQLGAESRHPGVPYIVFPGDFVFLSNLQTSHVLIYLLFQFLIYSSSLSGNVGDNKALADVVKFWARPIRSSTKQLLLVRPIRKIN